MLADEFGITTVARENTRRPSKSFKHPRNGQEHGANFVRQGSRTLEMGEFKTRVSTSFTVNWLLLQFEDKLWVIEGSSKKRRGCWRKVLLVQLIFSVSAVQHATEVTGRYRKSHRLEITFRSTANLVSPATLSIPSLRIKLAR